VIEGLAEAVCGVDRGHLEKPRRLDFISSEVRKHPDFSEAAVVRVVASKPVTFGEFKAMEVKIAGYEHLPVARYSYLVILSMDPTTGALAVVGEPVPSLLSFSTNRSAQPSDRYVSDSEVADGLESEGLR